ncbi:hypothetical protein [Peribacillus kribbensis]|uniref:hypothetical protein n=1 Tax=Peribacillus kribbensis TaxID=356658 RepID=UPI00040D5ED6|nr:hypothetical protein [Peribacillus kribbensis]
MFTTIPPKGDFFPFDNEEEYIRKVKEWGLISASAKSPKKEFLYKRQGSVYTVAIEGYQTSGSHETAVVSFANDVLHCVHPAYLKEMQSGSFGKEVLFVLDEQEAAESGGPEPVKEGKAAKSPKKKEAKPKKKQLPAIELPAEKVSFTAAIQEFSTKYNHFNETEEEIIIFKDVIITGDSPVEVGEAWCGYSKTLKKLELGPEDQLTFDGKIVDRKLNKDIRYKINNPSKLQVEKA